LTTLVPRAVGGFDERFQGKAEYLCPAFPRLDRTLIDSLFPLEPRLRYVLPDDHPRISIDLKDNLIFIQRGVDDIDGAVPITEGEGQIIFGQMNVVERIFFPLTAVSTRSRNFQGSGALDKHWLCAHENAD